MSDGLLAEEFQYSPTVTINETSSPDLPDVKIGQQIKAILDFTVVEKTKSYTILRVNNVFMAPSRRKF